MAVLRERGSVARQVTALCSKGKWTGQENSLQLKWKLGLLLSSLAASEKLIKQRLCKESTVGLLNRNTSRHSEMMCYLWKARARRGLFCSGHLLLLALSLCILAEPASVLQILHDCFGSRHAVSGWNLLLLNYWEVADFLIEWMSQDIPCGHRKLN